MTGGMLGKISKVSDNYRDRRNSPESGDKARGNQSCNAAPSTAVLPKGTIKSL